MRFLTRPRLKNRPPNESFQVGSLNCAVWSVIGKNGRHRIHWKLSRANPDPEGDSFSLMHVQNIRDYPLALSILCGGFSKVSSLDPDLREDLAKLEVLLLDVVARLKANGESDEEMESNEAIFGKL